MKNILLIFLFSIFAFSAIAQVNYTANNQVTPYTGFFRPGINLGYFPPYNDTDLGNIAAGNPELGISGIGARATRPGFSEWYTTYFGYDTHIPIFQHYETLGMTDLTCIIGFPADEHRDTKSYCSDGTRSEMFSNLYTPIWDNWANGTPYNDENYLAAYMYKLVSTYKDHVKFWEIWNEPGFDHSGDLGWRPKGSPGNWFDNDPDPCANHTKAPIQHFIRTLRICYDVIKTIDPDAYVALSGVGYESFLDAVLRNTDNPNGGGINPDYPLTGGAYFDVMGFHTYPDIDGSVKKWNPSTSDWDYHRNSDAAAQGVINRKTTYEKRLALYGYDGITYPRKEWICTEMNTPRVKFDKKSMASEASQVNYIIKAVVNAMKINLRQIHPYQLADTKKTWEARDEFDLMGMYLNMEDTQPYNQLVKTKEGIAYKTLSDFVFGTTYDPVKTTAMHLSDDLDGAAFWDVEKKHFKYIIWAKTKLDLDETASGTFTFPNIFGINKLKKHDWDFSETGIRQDMNAESIILSGRPIYLEEDEVSMVSQITLNCPPSMEVTLPNGQDEISVVWPNINASTSCPNFLINFEQIEGPSLGSMFSEGVHTIAYKVSDTCNNIDTCSFEITVVKPISAELNVNCLEDIHVIIPAGQNKIAVEWSAPTATTTCSNDEISISQLGGFPSGTEFYEGEYTINFMISDECNQKTCSFKIFVTQSTLSGEIALECPNDIDITINSLDTEVMVNWDEPTATSTCPTNNISIQQTKGLPSGSLFSIGEHIIEYKISDACDFKMCSFTIVITQSLSGEISLECPENMEFVIPSEDDSITIHWETPIATTSCPTNNVVLEQIQGPISGSAFTIGDYLIEYKTSDSCDEDTCSFLITVTKSTSTKNIYFSKISLAPNPATDKISLAINSDISNEFDFRIYNTHGQLVILKHSKLKNGKNIIDFDIDRLESGVYYLRVMGFVVRFLKV